MMPKHTGEPDLALAGLVLLIIFAFMMWQDRPIQSPRPVDLIDAKQHTPRATGNSYEGWLWQDPFDFDPEVELSRSKSTDEESKHQSVDSNNHQCGFEDNLFVEFDKVKSNGRALLPFIQMPSDTVETKEFRVRYRYAVVSGLIEAGYRPLNPYLLNFCVSGVGSKYNVRWEQWERLPPDKTKNKETEYIFVIWSDDYESVTNVLIESNKQITTYCFNDNHNLMHLNSSERKCSTKDHGNNDQALIHKLTDELIRKRFIIEPLEIAIISEFDRESTQNLSKVFKESFCAQSSKGCEENNVRDFTYLKGLDAYRRSAGKQEQQEIANKAMEKRDHLLSIIDQHNLPAGPGQLDYLYRLARQIKESHNDSDHKKHIKAVGVFGSDFYDKLIVFQALRDEIPNIVLFTTDLDAEMLHPQYWRWTRNLIVATPFDLRLKDKFQNQTPPFRDSLQTQIYFEILRTFKLVEENVSTSPLVFEIGRNGAVYLTGYEENSIHPNYEDNDLVNKNKQLLLWVLIVGAFIFIVQQIKPHSGIIVIWLAITAIVLFAIAFSAVNLTDEPFSFTGGVSMWPTILLRWLTFSLALLFIFSTIRSLEANFDRLTRRYYSRLVDSEDNKLITLCPDEKTYTERELIRTIRYWMHKNIEFPTESNIALFLITSSIIICAYGISFQVEFLIPTEFLIFASFIIFILLLCNSDVRQTIFEVSLTVFLVVIVIVVAIAVTASFALNPFIIGFLVLLICCTLVWEKKIVSIQTWVQRDVIRAPSPNASKDQNNNRNYTAKAVMESKELWKEYHERGRLKHRLLRASIKVSVFVIVTIILYRLFPGHYQTCRGDGCIALEGILRVLTFTFIMLLTFLVLDAQRLCLHWIEKLRTKHPLLMDSSTLTGGYRDKITEVYDARYDRNAIYKLKDIITLIAKRTRVVDRLIYYPLIVIMLMLIARINYFDNIAFPLHVGFTVILSISLLLYAGAKLRTEAVQLKRAAINCAKELSHPDRDVVIQEIQAIDYGAFEPLFEQPAIRSLLLTLGFVSLVVTEYLRLLG